MTYSTSLKRKILEYLKSRNDFVNGGELEEYAISLGFKASNCDRRVRELAKSGLLESRKNGVSKDWRYLVPKPRSEEEKEAERQRILQFSIGG